VKAAECFLLLHMMKAHKQRQVNNSPGKAANVWLWCESEDEAPWRSRHGHAKKRS
jgi:hypothetical protein